MIEHQAMPLKKTQKTRRNPQKIGVISDTHGLLRPEALAALRGVDLIIHAGDIGSREIIDRLNEVAPTLAIRGNNDREPWAKSIPETRLLECGPSTIFVIHNLKELGFDPAGRRIGVVISGHSHKPSITERDGVLYVNPGSAGPRRFKLPIAIATLHIDSSKATAKILELTA